MGRVGLQGPFCRYALTECCVNVKWTNSLDLTWKHLFVVSAGFMPRVIKVAPACAVMISSYEFGKTFFQKMNLDRAQLASWSVRIQMLSGQSGQSFLRQKLEEQTDLKWTLCKHFRMLLPSNKNTDCDKTRWILRDTVTLSVFAKDLSKLLQVSEALKERNSYQLTLIQITHTSYWKDWAGGFRFDPRLSLMNTLPALTRLTLESECLLNHSYWSLQGSGVMLNTWWFLHVSERKNVLIHRSCIAWAELHDMYSPVQYRS